MEKIEPLRKLSITAATNSTLSLRQYLMEHFSISKEEAKVRTRHYYKTYRMAYEEGYNKGVADQQAICIERACRFVRNHINDFIPQDHDCIDGKDMNDAIEKLKQSMGQ